MGLQIKRVGGTPTQEGGGMIAKERLYETTDGILVREGDPRGAFLAYAIGDPIEGDRAKQAAALTGEMGVTSAAYTDDETRDLLRARQAGDPVAGPMVQAVVAGSPTAPVLMHDRLATELADEARVRANTGQASLDLTDEVADRRVNRDADGNLVADTDPKSATLAYTPGMPVARGDLKAYRALPPVDDEDQDDTTGAPADDTTPDADPTPDPTPTPAVKKTAAPANKSAGRAADK